MVILLTSSLLNFDVLKILQEIMRRTVALRKKICWQTGLSTKNFPESYRSAASRKYQSRHFVKSIFCIRWHKEYDKILANYWILTKLKQEMFQKHLCPPWCKIQVYLLCRSKTCTKQVTKGLKYIKWKTHWAQKSSLTLTFEHVTLK